MAQLADGALRQHSVGTGELLRCWITVIGRVGEVGDVQASRMADTGGGMNLSGNNTGAKPRLTREGVMIEVIQWQGQRVEIVSQTIVRHGLLRDS